MENYINKELPANRNPKRRNQKPEKEVEKAVLDWCRLRGWHVTVVEAKTNFSAASGRYTSQNVAPGFSDIIGNNSYGYLVAIELKAPGKRSTLRPKQREFLQAKIETNCFAIVCDCVEYLQKTYAFWAQLLPSAQQDFLRQELPKIRQSRDDGPLF